MSDDFDNKDDLTKDFVERLKAAGTDIAPLDEEEPDLSGLTKQQRSYLRLRLRGIPESQVPDIMQGMSAGDARRCEQKVREHLKHLGSTPDGDRAAGEAIATFDELKRRAWGLFLTGQQDPKFQLKCLQEIRKIQETHNKFLMDLGKLIRVPKQEQLELSVKRPEDIPERLTAEQKQRMVQALVAGDLSELEAPAPPAPIEDAEFEEVQ